jgi:hypothetical protein
MERFEERGFFGKNDIFGLSKRNRRLKIWEVLCAQTNRAEGSD